jgi:hypothetical protein
MVKNKVTIVLTILDCKDCPYYSVKDDEDCYFGGMHYCMKMQKLLTMGGRPQFGQEYEYPDIPIPDDCPLLAVDE